MRRGAYLFQCERYASRHGELVYKFGWERRMKALLPSCLQISRNGARPGLISRPVQIGHKPVEQTCLSESRGDFVRVSRAPMHDNNFGLALFRRHAGRVNAFLLINAGGKKTSIHYDALSSDIARGTGSEKDCGPGKLIDFAKTLHRRAHEQFTPALCPIQ